MTQETGHTRTGVTPHQNKIGILAMPGNPREIVTMAERHFHMRIRIAVPTTMIAKFALLYQRLYNINMSYFSYLH